jgi:hypothetical protein
MMDMQDPKLAAKKEALQELIKMMQDMMVGIDGGEKEEEESPEQEMLEEKEPEMDSDLSEMVKSEMKKGGKIQAPKKSMLAVSVKASAPKMGKFGKR